MYKPCAIKIFVLSLPFLGALQAYSQDVELQGGDLTSDLPGRSAIQVFAPNVTDEARRLKQVAGFEVFHRIFTAEEGLGPEFVHNSCGGCHLDNGRGRAKFSRSPLGGSQMVVKVALPGLNSDGTPVGVPGIGGMIHDHIVSGRNRVRVDLAWEDVQREYPDGTTYVLRRPKLDLRIRGLNERKIIRSLRMTPPVIGVGLLEAISESEILSHSDPLDVDGDGISGHPNHVIDVKTGQYVVGRFGYKASHPTVEQQSAGAFANDMQVTNPLFPDALGGVELSAEKLELLVIYQKLAGVPRAENQSDAKVLAGKEHFKAIGCDGCHRMSIVTADHSDPELSSQEIHPFTDLLLHDMGRELADQRAEFLASGPEWRTTPLWGLGFSRRLAGGRTIFMHDGRARSIEEAILWHAGEASRSRHKFKELSKAKRAELISFLDSL